MKGQSWSMDLVIAVVIFGFIAVIFYSLILIDQKPSVEDLRNNAQLISQKLEQPIPGCGPIIQNQSITQAQLQCLFNQSYTNVRDSLGVAGSFCIYVEDSQGRLLVVSNGSDNFTGFGDPGLIVSGTPCGIPIAP